ncbi:MAG: mechanosensitive ion channel [Proteobacteria bacterium]|nr:mechanosensitive ion channel [Pseudomonadota bacterium]
MEIQDIIDQVVEAVTLYGLDVIGAIIILVVGYILSKRIPKTMTNIMNKKGVDPTVSGFLGSMVKFTILAVTVIFVLSQFGVQTASLVAVFGAAGLAIGLALQGTLSNVAGGVMLLIFRPMKVGDYVEVGGYAGSIKSIDLFTTELATPDNIQIIIPNGTVWGSAISNYSFHATRRMDFVIGIAYEDDIDRARAIIEKVVTANEMSHKDPAPLIEVAELADSSVNFTVRVWCDNGNYFPLKFALTKAIKQTFDKEGVSIPYPQQVIHRVEEAS